MKKLGLKKEPEYITRSQTHLCTRAGDLAPFYFYPADITIFYSDGSYRHVDTGMDRTYNNDEPLFIIIKDENAVGVRCGFNYSGGLLLNDCTRLEWVELIDNGLYKFTVSCEPNVTIKDLSYWSAKDGVTLEIIPRSQHLIYTEFDGINRRAHIYGIPYSIGVHGKSSSPNTRLFVVGEMPFLLIY